MPILTAVSPTNVLIVALCPPLSISLFIRPLMYICSYPIRVQRTSTSTTTYKYIPNRCVVRFSQNQFKR
jgi:hypothetical protein